MRVCSEGDRGHLGSWEDDCGLQTKQWDSSIRAPDERDGRYHAWCSSTQGRDGSTSRAPRASIRWCNSRGAHKRDSKQSSLVTGQSRTERTRVLASCHAHTAAWVHTARWRWHGRPCHPARSSVCVGGAACNTVAEPGGHAGRNTTPCNVLDASVICNTRPHCARCSPKLCWSTVRPPLTFEFRTAVLFTPHYAHWWTASTESFV